MSQLILKISYRHSTIKAPDSKAVPEQMGMYPVPVLPCLILALYLLQAGSGTYQVTATATNNLSVSSGKSPAISVKIICPPGEMNKNGICQCPSTGQQYVNGKCTCTTKLCNGQCCGADQVCTNGKCVGCSGGRVACNGFCCPTGEACNSVTGMCVKPPHGGMPVKKSNCVRPPHPKGMGYASGRTPIGFLESSNCLFFVVQIS